MAVLKDLSVTNLANKTIQLKNTILKLNVSSSNPICLNKPGTAYLRSDSRFTDSETYIGTSLPISTNISSDYLLDKIMSFENVLPRTTGRCIFVCGKIAKTYNTDNLSASESYEVVIPVNQLKSNTGSYSNTRVNVTSVHLSVGQIYYECYDTPENSYKNANGWYTPALVACVGRVDDSFGNYGQHGIYIENINNVPNIHIPVTIQTVGYNYPQTGSYGYWLHYMIWLDAWK